MDMQEQKILRALSHQYKNVAAASTEVINLQSIMKCILYTSPLPRDRG